MATVSKMFCTGSRRALANRCLPIFISGRFPEDILLATSSAVTCGRVGAVRSHHNKSPRLQHVVHAVEPSGNKLGLNLAMLGVVGHGVLPGLPSARQSHLQLGPV